MAPFMLHKKKNDKQQRCITPRQNGERNLPKGPLFPR
ncbi:uncharacterized protein G2W53_040721 [Senna tora]|uniref:Uncharacterized protein n=1 Tax=Senna tora TaxID=362788 RepID=A0A834SCQ1_9FABA|nr:uncharacterized protein G2W53_040721 [Senna tora]